MPPAVAPAEEERTEEDEIEEAPPAEGTAPEGETEADDQDAPPPTDPMDFSDLLDPETGKIYGKFDTPAQAIRAYKEAERNMGRKSQEAADLRKTLTEAGYTFDAQGKPVPPAKPAPPQGEGQQQEAPAPVIAAAPQPDAELPFDREVARDAEGVPLNFLGMPIVSEEEWEEMRQTDDRAYARTVYQYERLQADRLSQWRRQRDVQRSEALETERTRIRQVAKDKWELPESFMDEVEAKVKAEVIPTLQPHLRNDPQAFRMAMQLQAAEMMPAYYKKLMDDALSGNTEVAARAQKVIRSERTSRVPADAANANNNGLSADEKRMAKELGVSEDAYIRNRNRGN